MKELASQTWILAKQLLLLQGSREVYALLALNSASAFVAGLIAASLL